MAFSFHVLIGIAELLVIGVIAWGCLRVAIQGRMKLILMTSTLTDCPLPRPATAPKTPLSATRPAVESPHEHDRCRRPGR